VGAPSIAILAKAPVPGRAKTRLGPALGADGAARVQGALIRHTLAVARATGLRVRLWWDGPEDLAPPGVERHPQPAGDLGARMAAAARRPERVVIIGTDAPTARPTDLLEAAAAGGGVAIGAALDGGYWCISPPPSAPDALLAALFDAVPWSTDQVGPETRRRLQARGVPIVELRALGDLDTPDDLDRLLRDPACPAQLRAALSALRPPP
jgi:rSAM/selenodomain-associated transferase 1